MGKTKKDLARYLADYVNYEIDNYEKDDLEGIQDILEQGLDAFESTEDVELIVRENE